MSDRRSSDAFIFFIAVNILVIFFFFLHSSLEQKRAIPVLRGKEEMVKNFGLTDLCLFTDARYTRHPSMADLSTPFQDHPMSLEHFPSGSILTPPAHLRSDALD
jgi:hypothetical protein